MEHLKNMSQKIILTIIFITISLFILSTHSNAEGKLDLDTDIENIDIKKYQVGEYYRSKPYQLTGAYYVLSKHFNTYCVDHKTHLYNNVEYIFHVTNKIHIEGKNAKIEEGYRTGTTTSNRYNAILAYILAQKEQGYSGGDVRDSTIVTHSQGQYAVWHTWNNFIMSFGLFDWRNQNNENDEIKKNIETNRIYQAAEQYADELDGITADIEDKTILEDNSKVGVELVKYNTSSLNYINGAPSNDATVSYIKVGPLNWKYSGSIQNMTITSEDGKESYGDVKFLRTINGINTIGNANEIISSEKDFYMLLSPTRDVKTKIKASIKVNSQYTEYFGDLKMFYASEGQNFIIADFKDRPVTREKSLDLSYELNTGDLLLYKYDVFHQERKPLAGVKFKLQHKDTGLYIKKDGDKITYITAENEATEFVTNTDGSIDLNNIVPGKYLAHEIENPNNNYDLHPGVTAEIQVDGNRENEFKEYNSQVLKPAEVSGYAWGVNRENSKEEEAVTRNDSTYKEGRDRLLKDIKVELYRYKKLELKYDDNGNLLPIDEQRDMVNIPNGELIETKTTDGNGYYKMTTKDVRYPELELKYYKVKFTYDGMDYQACYPEYNESNLPDPDTNKHNGVLVGTSKASEDDKSREDLNNNFAIISGEENNSLTKGYARKIDNTKTATLEYSYENGESKLKNIVPMINQNIKSVTATYDLMAGNPDGNPGYASYYNDYQNNQNKNIYGEVVRINLALVNREMPDLATSNQIESVVTTINGYNNLYTTTLSRNAHELKENNPKIGLNYVIANSEDEGEDKLSKFTVYPSDVKTWSKDSGMADSNKLQVYVTYKVGITNQSDLLYNKIKELAVYYDSNYELKYIGNSLDGNKYNYTAADDIKSNNSSYSNYTLDGYKKACIKIDDFIKPQDTKNIYMTYKVSDNELIKMLEASEKGETYTPQMKNVVEINAYSTYSEKDETKLYAGIDKDSAAGNMTDINQRDDDTDLAREFTISQKGTRTLTGAVFLDESVYDNRTQERTSDSIYDKQKEKLLKNVDVLLVSQANNDQSVNAVTGDKVTIQDVDNARINGSDYKITYEDLTENNTYKISGFVPGNYVIEYKYNNKTYYENGPDKSYINGVDYKSAIVRDVEGKTNVKTAFENNGKITDWYKLDNESNAQDVVRYNEAADVWAQRQKVDNQYSKMNMENSGDDTTSNKNETMIARTPIMNVSVELITTSEVNLFEQKYYDIKNMDFGITDRAKQSIELIKEVSGLKLTLANGQVLIDANLENGKITGEAPGIKAIPGKVSIELDNELMHGAELEIIYSISFKNTSEKDYYTQEYYSYGTNKTNIVKLAPNRVADYVSNDLTFDANDELNKKYGWYLAKYQWNKEENQAVLKLNNDPTIGKIENGTLHEDVKNVVTKKSNINTIAETKNLDIPIEPEKTSEKIQIKLEKLLSNTDQEMVYNNDAEIVTVSKTGGRTINQTLGKYPSNGIGSAAQEITITPPTGIEISNIVSYIVAAVGVLAIVSSGVAFIILRRKSK